MYGDLSRRSFHDSLAKASLLSCKTTPLGQLTGNAAGANGVTSRSNRQQIKAKGLENLMACRESAPNEDRLSLPTVPPFCTRWKEEEKVSPSSSIKSSRSAVSIQQSPGPRQLFAGFPIPPCTGTRIPGVISRLREYKDQSPLSVLSSFYAIFSCFHQ